jgi:hypothetical protein
MISSRPGGGTDFEAKDYLENGLTLFDATEDGVWVFMGLIGVTVGRITGKMGGGGGVGSSSSIFIA